MFKVFQSENRYLLDPNSDRMKELAAEFKNRKLELVLVLFALSDTDEELRYLVNSLLIS